MATAQPNHILVVGAGLGGALIATALAKAGHRVEVYERRPDPRVGTAAALVVGMGLTVYAVVWRGETFDLTAFGTGIGLILAAGGGAMWARKDREGD